MTAGIERNDDLGCWVVTDRVLAREILARPDFSSATFGRSFQLYMSEDAREQHRELTRFLSLWFVQCDGPEHMALRRPVQQTLSVSRFRAMRPRIEEIVDDALDDLAAAEIPDVIPVVADAVSARVMSQLVGLDGESARKLHEWSRDLSAFIGAMYNRRHASAADTAMKRVTATLASAPVMTGPGCPRSSAPERDLATWSMILFGGLETTSSLLGSAVLHLVGDTLIRDAIASGKPGAARGLVESVLETRPPLRNLGRVAARDLELAGCRIAAGSLILVSLVEDLFPDREDAAETQGPAPGDDRHITFGHGPHYCIGAPLARLEAEVLVEHFARRFPSARLAADGAVWGPNLSYIGLQHLYLELEVAPT